MNTLRRIWDWLEPALIDMDAMGATAYHEAVARAEMPPAPPALLLVDFAANGTPSARLMHPYPQPAPVEP